MPFPKTGGWSRNLNERKANPGFMADFGRYQVSPADIDDWCQKNGWKAVTFRLVQ